MKLIIEKIILQETDLASTSASSWTIGMQIDHMLGHAASGDERVLCISLAIEDEEWAAIRAIVRDNASVAAGFDAAADKIHDAMMSTLDTPSMAANPKLKLGRKMRVVPVNK